MFNYFLKKIVKSNNFEKKNNRDAAIKLSGIFGLIINIFLFSTKMIVGLMINSISIMGDSVNNLSDSLNSIVTIVGAYLSNKPADDEHPYGHGRTEYIVTMIVGVFIIVTGVQIFISSVSSIFNPREMGYSTYSVIILVVSILLKFYMFLMNRKVGKLCKSELNFGLAKDSLNDVIATTFVLISLLIYRIYKINIDGFVGLVIAFLVVKTGFDMFLSMGNVLLGVQIDKEKHKKLKQIILEGKYITGVHAIEIHEYGKGQYFGSCHVDAPANIDVYSMHSIIHDLEIRVYEETGIKISMHIDPKYLLESDKYKKIEDEKILEEID